MPGHFFTPTNLRDASPGHDRSEHRRLCATWMEERRMYKLRFVGPFGDLSSFRRGTKVRVPTGTVIGTPHCKSKGKVAKRSYDVTLHDHYMGYIDGERVIQPTLLWAGSGGYWHYCDPNDVEIVSVAQVA